MLYSVNCLTMTQNNGPYVMLETSVPFKKVAVTFKLEEKYIGEKNALFLAFHFFLLPFVKKVVVWKLGDTTRLSGCSLCDLLFKELLCDPSACESFLVGPYTLVRDLFEIVQKYSRSCHYLISFKMYRVSSPYANFITANFITAIFQKIAQNLHKSNIWLMRILANANFFLNQKSH